MARTEVRGKDILIKRPPMHLFSAFSDLRIFAAALPDHIKNQVEIGPTYARGQVKGINMGIVLDRKQEFSLVSYKDESAVPFPFNISFVMVPVGFDSTLFHIEFAAELNTMMKMMIGSKLQKVVDEISDKIEAAASGQMPDMPNFNNPI